MSSTPAATPTPGTHHHNGCVPEPPGNEELAPWVEAAGPAPAESQWKAAAPGGIRSRGEAREAKVHGQEGCRSSSAALVPWQGPQLAVTWLAGCIWC
ncbi:hypothetical protein DL769_005257 [Monosporascus sp. CRB-8-3]|nr:hypothetical protein DL769_005257 [Monosporascus sp. CRB-8-3]